MSLTERLIDVRQIEPRHRHPLIFKTWDDLSSGEAILLVNDHDPVPLYYQFAAENPGQFKWEYLEKGPIWRVRITKGEFADPGFVPTKRSTEPCPQPIEFAEPVELDTRPIFARGATPCGEIDRAVESLIPGQLFVLLAPFEPVPLYTKLANQGFSHKATQLDEQTWRIEFRKDSEPVSTGASSAGLNTADHGCDCVRPGRA